MPDLKITAGINKQEPWLHLRDRIPPLQAVVDINQATAKQLQSVLSLPAATARNIVKSRRGRSIRDVADLAKAAKLTRAQQSKIRGRAVGSVLAEVVLLGTKVKGDRIYSAKPWDLAAEFRRPTGGNVVLVAAEVHWQGDPFVIEQKVSPKESAAGQVELHMGKEQFLPPGPVEISLTAYDDLGGASSQQIDAWVLPSNPFSMFISPRNRSIYNGSVRPDWRSPNWSTAVNVTFVNGDPGRVRLNRSVSWKFTDGGNNVESGNFDWPSGQISVPGNGRFSGWVSFSSPPGSGIFKKYEKKEDMTLELRFGRQGGGSIARSITCRVMGGWGVNIIKVGSFSAAENTTISQGISDARDVFEDHGLTFSSVKWWLISNAQAGGYRVLNNRDEWEDLMDDWTVNNDSVDCFVVRDMWDNVAGFSPVGGPAKKNTKGADGLAVDMSMACFAHELGHYMGDHGHADGLGRGNVMHSTCGGRNFTYDQYKKFFKHGWTRIVR